MTNITIITYHYVRKIKDSEYPEIKGLEIENFKRQLKYLEDNYKIIEPSDLINNEVKNLKENLCLLSFDDGFKDHVEYVLPELEKKKIKACFFPPAASVVENILLDVHALHFILAVTKNISDLISELNLLCKKQGYSQNDIKKYWDKYAKSNEFDTKEVIYFKRMLQFVLPSKLRKEIIKNLFKKFLKTSPNEFAKKLYMNKDDLRKLLNHGMYIGSHSYNHDWLNELSYEEQEIDIAKSLEFLKDIGAPIKAWIMCYPYGSFNENTISILKKKNCSYGFTTISGLADLEKDPFKLFRKDTNEFPQ